MSDLNSSEIYNSIHILADLMLENKLKLATAESCTGGMLSQYITSVSGSSKWFECGYITYSNESKIRLLSVDANVLHECGAVSDIIAGQMAIGALKISAADLSVSITGIAGPEGGSKQKPVGSVFIATCKKLEKPNTSFFQFEGNRDAIRQQSTYMAIKIMIGLLSKL